MALATYTVTQNGSSNGNTISQPFTIEVHGLRGTDAGAVSGTTITTCTKNGSGNECVNDDISESKTYALSETFMGTTPDATLTSTLEADLTSAYGANWIKN